jgi:hypothetical protein
MVSTNKKIFWRDKEGNFYDVAVKSMGSGLDQGILNVTITNNTNRISVFIFYINLSC